jgi:hypothetical protein
MIPASAGLMVSRGGNDRHVASIFLPISTEESTSAGRTFALAAVSAFALAIAESGSDPARAGMAGSKPAPGPDRDRNSRLT